MFISETGELYRLRVPFENITTSVFLLVTPQGPVLYDCATTAADIENTVLPALARMDIAPEQLYALVLSHAHSDHNGGLKALFTRAPQIQVLAQTSQKHGVPVYVPKDGEMLFESVRTLYLPGHTADCLGLYDLRSETLLSADALQLRGIDRYGCAVAYPKSYVKTVEKIRQLSLDRILTSHEYIPCGEKAEGAKEIRHYLDNCLEALFEIERFVMKHRQEDEGTIIEAFSAQHPHWPPLPRTTIKSLLNEQA